MMKKRDGFTLVELLLAMVSASIVTGAVITLVLLGMRIHNRSSEVSRDTNTVRTALYAMESVLKQSPVVRVEGGAENGSVDWKVMSKENEEISETELLSYDAEADKITMESAANALLENVTKSTAKLTDKLLEITLTIDGEEYSFSVYCRLTPTVPTEGSSDEATSVLTSAEIPDTASIYNIEARNRFLSVLAAEEGSTGASLTTGEYFSEWYIGSYEANPAWSEDTPWCACFLSWALEQCSDDLFGTAPRFAHVDQFLGFFPSIHEDPAGAQPGDILFFDMEDDGTSEPTHVGAVVNVENGRVYTIEGNTAGVVAGRSYGLDDSRILGYGVLNWK